MKDLFKYLMILIVIVEVTSLKIFSYPILQYLFLGYPALWLLLPIVIVPMVGFEKNTKGHGVVFITLSAITAFVFALIAVNIYVDYIPPMFELSEVTQAQMDLSFANDEKRDYWSVFPSVLFAPIVEEILFRLVLIGFGRKIIGLFLSFLLTSVLFSIGHSHIGIEYITFDSIVYFAPYFILAVVLTFVYLKLGIYCAILTHMLINLAKFVKTTPLGETYILGVIVVFSLLCAFILALIILTRLVADYKKSMKSRYRVS